MTKKTIYPLTGGYAEVTKTHRVEVRILNDRGEQRTTSASMTCNYARSWKKYSALRSSAVATSQQIGMRRRSTNA